MESILHFVSDRTSRQEFGWFAMPAGALTDWFTSKFSLFLYQSHCLSYVVFLSSPSFSVCLSVSLNIWRETRNSPDLLAALQLTPSPDSLLFPVPIRMRHSCKLYTLNLTDIFRPALIFHSVQSRHLLGTLRFLILISDLAYETIALFQCK